ncbi:aldehyde dehydrogenase family protein [uncultured Thiohalocapsa sp.]|uniref:aldehyde dehydrogenase family protein n=1 Tax=uncultured Thiohalocapsa sp. TaxID=768990 RepID=UPI0025D5EDCC|nr:aldehyde dehydrogenase family protein [uncultured Thiohalocapsa sp.]
MQRLADASAPVDQTRWYNTLSLHGRGVFACISPWNFPLAIFMGQVTAALTARKTLRRPLSLAGGLLRFLRGRSTRQPPAR